MTLTAIESTTDVQSASHIWLTASAAEAGNDAHTDAAAFRLAIDLDADYREVRPVLADLVQALRDDDKQAATELVRVLVGMGKR
jgi:hypothetical protein